MKGLRSLAFGFLGLVFGFGVFKALGHNPKRLCLKSFIYRGTSFV